MDQGRVKVGTNVILGAAVLAVGALESQFQFRNDKEEQT